MARVAISPAESAVPRDRASAPPPEVASRGVSLREAAQIGEGDAPVWLLAAGRGAAVRLAARTAIARLLSPARPDARAAETEDPGSLAGVAAAGSGAAAGPVDHRRPPLAGCLHLGVSQPPGGPGGHHALIHAAHLSPDVPPAM